MLYLYFTLLELRLAISLFFRNILHHLFICRFFLLVDLLFLFLHMSLLRYGSLCGFHVYLCTLVVSLVVDFIVRGFRGTFDFFVLLGYHFFLMLPFVGPLRSKLRLRIALLL